MSKIRRLMSLVFTLSLIGLASLAMPFAAKPDPCSQYNTSHCIYHWDSESSCCVTSGGFCIQRCV